MGKLWWIMGGTAVGKKHFINRCVERGDVASIGLGSEIKAAWMNDGVVRIRYAQKLRRSADVLIRWQWGRERFLRRMLKRGDPNGHRIVLLWVDPILQERRATDREGQKRWTVDDLQNEAVSIANLVLDLKKAHGIKVHGLDSNNNAYRHIGV